MKVELVVRGLHHPVRLRLPAAGAKEIVWTTAYVAMRVENAGSDEAPGQNWRDMVEVE